MCLRNRTVILFTLLSPCAISDRVLTIGNLIPVNRAPVYTSSHNTGCNFCVCKSEETVSPRSLNSLQTNRCQKLCKFVFTQFCIYIQVNMSRSVRNRCRKFIQLNIHFVSCLFLYLSFYKLSNQVPQEF